VTVRGGLILASKLALPTRVIMVRWLSSKIGGVKHQSGPPLLVNRRKSAPAQRHRVANFDRKPVKPESHLFGVRYVPLQAFRQSRKPAWD